MEKVSTRQIDAIRKMLAELPGTVKKPAELAALMYIVGDTGHGLKHYQPYKYVPFAIGAGWSTDPIKRRAQQRWLFKAIKDGRVTVGMSSSQGYMRDAWVINDMGRFYRAENDVAHTPLMVGDTTQTEHAKKQGWRKISDTIRDNLNGALRAAVAAVNRTLRDRIQKG